MTQFKTVRSPDVKTPLCRFAFTQSLFEPRAGEDGGRLNYGCSLLFSKDSDISAMKNACKNVALEALGNDAEKMIKNGLIALPFLDGDGPQAVSRKTSERHKGFEGHIFIRASTGVDFPPKLYNRFLKPAVKAEFYSGTYGYAAVNFFSWYNAKKGYGISCGLKACQVTKDGENLGGSYEFNPNGIFEAEVMPDGVRESADGAAALF